LQVPEKSFYLKKQRINVVFYELFSGFFVPKNLKSHLFCTQKAITKKLKINDLKTLKLFLFFVSDYENNR
jgi:hypothetical protein